jgi:hypothetical protein
MKDYCLYKMSRICGECNTEFNTTHGLKIHMQYHSRKIIITPFLAEMARIEDDMKKKSMALARHRNRERRLTTKDNARKIDELAVEVEDLKAQVARLITLLPPTVKV